MIKGIIEPARQHTIFLPQNLLQRLERTLIPHNLCLTEDGDTPFPHQCQALANPHYTMLHQYHQV